MGHVIQSHRLRKTLAWTGLIVGVLTMASLGWGASITLAAQDSTAVSQSFAAKNTDGSMVAGALVSLSNTTNRTVTLSTSNSRNSLIGAVSKTPLLALSTTNTSQVQVAIAGDAPIFVSDVNGPIAAGDRITASPFSGVGMKATTDGQVVGTAQQAFSLASSSVEHIKDKSGVAHTIHVGQIIVRLNVSSYVAPNGQFLPPFLQKLANTVAGKPVSLVRVLVACALLVLALTSIFAILYSSTHSAITSIGRNPLAAHAINKGLVQVALLALLVLAFASLAAYLILAI